MTAHPLNRAPAEPISSALFSFPTPSISPCSRNAEKPIDRLSEFWFSSFLNLWQVFFHEECNTCVRICRSRIRRFASCHWQRCCYGSAGWTEVNRSTKAASKYLEQQTENQQSESKWRNYVGSHSTIHHPTPRDKKHTLLKFLCKTGRHVKFMWPGLWPPLYIDPAAHFPKRSMEFNILWHRCLRCACDAHSSVSSAEFTRETNS